MVNESNCSYGTQLDKRGMQPVPWVKVKFANFPFHFRFRSITQSYYRSAHALILVYDISCQPTFDCLADWLREIGEYANANVLKILVGNKIDRDDREIPVEIGEEFARQHGMYFLETSAKQADNVERLFYEIAAELVSQARKKEVPRSETGLADLHNNRSKWQQNVSECCSGTRSDT